MKKAGKLIFLYTVYQDYKKEEKWLKGRNCVKNIWLKVENFSAWPIFPNLILSGIKSIQYRGRITGHRTEFKTLLIAD